MREPARGRGDSGGDSEGADHFTIADYPLAWRCPCRAPRASLVYTFGVVDGVVALAVASVEPRHLRVPADLANIDWVHELHPALK